MASKPDPPFSLLFPQPRQMAPGQIPHQPAPWSGTHPFFLLSPLMGLLNRAWSLLRGPGPPEPWQVEAVIEADQGGAGLEDEAKASLATYHAPWGRHPQEETEDSGAAEEDGEASPGACPDLEAKHSLPEVWGLSDDGDEKYSEEEATGVPREQEEFMDGQPAPLPLSLLIRSLPDLPGEKESKEEAVTGGNEVTRFSFPLSHWECCPGEEEDEEEEDGEALRVCGPVNGATEERTETEAATKTSMYPSSVGSHLRSWECCLGEEPEEEEKDKQAGKGDADPGPHSTSLAQRPSLRTWQHPSSAITEEEEKEDCDSEEMGASSSVPPTSAFLSAWVYRPEEDTEEEEDCDSEATEDEGEAEVSSAISLKSSFLSAWVYRPGEDTEEEEDCDSEATEDEGEAGVSSAIPPTSAFLSTWVYRPGEDTEEEDEYEEEDDESGAADLGPSPSLQTQSALLRDQIYQPEEKTDGGETPEKWGEAEPCPFRVAIYLPGEKPPPPWAPPRLPLRLQRRLKSAQTPTRHLDLEPLPKTRKVGTENLDS